jgi:protoporphyrinogen oxidase
MSTTSFQGGAIQFIHALLRDLPRDTVSLEERLESIDLQKRVATTSRREIAFEHLISSAPFPKLLEMAEVAHKPSVFSSNKVLVFNLGFDRKGRKDVHWIYFPQRELRFYRVGFYDNIMDGDRMSLYVEIGAPTSEELSVEKEKARVLEDLASVGIVSDATLISDHSVVLDPAYVHITARSVTEVASLRSTLAEGGVHSIGRYGAWTYCSIEDNIIEARELAHSLC